MFHRPATPDVQGVSIRFSPDGTSLVVAGPFGFQVLDATTDRPPLLESRHDAEPVRNRHDPARYAPDGRRLRVLAREAVREWDLPGGEPQSALAGRSYPAPFHSASAVGPDASHFARTELADEGREAALIVEDAATGAVAARLPLGSRAEDPGESPLLSADGARVALLEVGQVIVSGWVQTDLRRLRIWDVPSGRLIADLGRDRLLGGADPGLVWQPLAAFSRDGSRFALRLSGTARAAGHSLQGTSIVIIDAETGRVARRFDPSEGEGEPAWVSALVFSPEGRRLALATADGRARRGDTPSSIQVWDVADGRLLDRIDRPGVQTPTLLRFTRDGRRLVHFIFSRHPEIDEWDPGTTHDVVRLPWQGANPNDLAVSPDASASPSPPARRSRPAPSGSSTPPTAASWRAGACPACRRSRPPSCRMAIRWSSRPPAGAAIAASGS